MRDAVNTIRYEFENYSFYALQLEQAKITNEKCKKKLAKSMNERYKKRCIRDIELSKIIIIHCTNQLKFMDDLLQNLPAEERESLYGLYVLKLPAYKIARKIGLSTEGELWLYINDIFKRVSERLCEKYAVRC